MNMLHELKTWPDPFQAIWDRKKLYEIREDDREFKVGDLLKLREFIPHEPCAGGGRVWDNGDRIECGCAKPHGDYTGRHIEAEVTYKTEGGEWNLPEELCVLSLSVAQRFDPRQPVRLQVVQAGGGIYTVEIPPEMMLRKVIVERVEGSSEFTIRAEG